MVVHGLLKLLRPATTEVIIYQEFKGKMIVGDMPVMIRTVWYRENVVYQFLNGKTLSMACGLMEEQLRKFTEAEITVYGIFDRASLVKKVSCLKKRDTNLSKACE